MMRTTFPLMTTLTPWGERGYTSALVALRITKYTEPPGSAVVAYNHVQLLSLLTTYKALLHLVPKKPPIAVTSKKTFDARTGTDGRAETMFMSHCNLVPSGSVKRFPMKRMRSTTTTCLRAAPRPNLKVAPPRYIRKWFPTAPSPSQATTTHRSQ